MSVVAAAGALRRERGASSSRSRGARAAGSAMSGGRAAIATGPLTSPDHHTLLITVDRLSPTPELLGVFRVPGSPVAVSSGLHLLTLDRLASLEQTWSAFAGLLGASLSDGKLTLPLLSTLAGIDGAELVALPGVEEFLLLRRIRDEAVSGKWARIVVDLSGVADPFALLRAAPILAQAIDRLWPRHRRLAAAAQRPVLAQLTAAIDSIARDCADISEVFADPHVVAGHLVVGADARGARLLAHQFAIADVMGFPIRSVVLNRGVRAGVATLTAPDDPQVLVTTIEASATILDRPARLRKLAVPLVKPNGVGRGSAVATVATISGSGLDTVLEMSWQQCLPDPQRFELGRSDDDLLVTVDGCRHALRLPSVLRRCQVVEGQWDGQRVRVRFTPDPALWPRDRGA